MIRLGLRLVVTGGREAIVRLVVLVGAVALGVGLLLVALSGIIAVNAQNARNAWLSTGEVHSGHGSLWWLLRADRYDGQLIGRIDVAATGPSSPVPPGLPTLPGPGEYYASPAMQRLLSSAPAAQLGVVAIGIGFAAAAMFAVAQLGYSLAAPGLAYYLITAAGIVTSLGIIAATMPLLRRLTGPDVARNE